MVATPGTTAKANKKPSEAKKKIVGTPVPIAPAPGTSSSPGADPKQKTATRSKSGCMTCRIRRKKCDLERVGDSCQTCVRLRIECLGWGSKRPEALRDANIVKQCQNMIKIFLASNNMIKGSARSSAQFINQGPPAANAQSPGASILQTTYSSSSEFSDPNQYPPSNGTNGGLSGPLLLPSPGTTLHDDVGSVGRSIGLQEPPSYVGANFLRFDFLRKHDIQGSMPHSLNEQSFQQNGSAPTQQLPGGPYPSSSINIGAATRNGSRAEGKGKGRQAAVRGAQHHAGMEVDGEDDDDDGEGDEFEHEEDTKPHMGPTYYPDPRYLGYAYPPHHPIGGHNPYAQPLHPYHPDPYHQSNLRSSSLTEKEVREQLNARERERQKEMDELKRKGVPSHGVHDPLAHPFQIHEAHQLVWGAGVGTAARTYASLSAPNGTIYPPPPVLHYAPPYPAYAVPMPHSGYSSSYTRGDAPYNGPPRLGGAAHRSLLAPPLSTARSTASQASPTGQTNGLLVNGSNGAYMQGSNGASPTTPLSGMSNGPFGSHRHSLDANGNISAGNYASGGEVEMDMEGDVDGEPMTQSQLTMPAPATVPQPPASVHCSFGNSYYFDKDYKDAELTLFDNNAITTTILDPNYPYAQTIMDPAFFASVLGSGETLQNIGLGNLNASDLLADPATTLGANIANVDVNRLQPFQQIMLEPAPHRALAFSPNAFSNNKELILLSHYRDHITKVQYFIAHQSDPGLAAELFQFAMDNRCALSGTLALASLFETRMRGVRALDASFDGGGATDVYKFKQETADALGEKLGASNMVTVDEGDAMGSLHLLSAVLFEGGTDAQWDHYLDIAKKWVGNHPVVRKATWPLADSSSASGADGATTAPAANDGALATLAQLDKKRGFIIKACFWFDILGAVTMRRAPHFLSAYQELFGRHGGSSMEKIMGCDEKVLLAIAETAQLSKWRWDMDRKGCLSVMELATRAAAIQKRLNFVGPVYYSGTYSDDSATTSNVVDGDADITLDNMYGSNAFGAAKTMQQNGGPEDGSNGGYNSGDTKQAHTTRLISNVFRATGRLYLHTVVSGCNPDVKEIKQAVVETMDAFSHLAPSPADKSLVFPIALAGCLTDDQNYRSYLVDRLKRLGREGEAVGNSKSCLQLMEKVWKKRDAPNGPRIVDWIDTMKEMGWSLLLV